MLNSVSPQYFNAMVASGNAQMVALFELGRRLAKKNYDSQLLPVLGSVLDNGSLKRVFSKHSPTVVFHADAYKHVAIAENNLAVTFRNNVLATMRSHRLTGR